MTTLQEASRLTSTEAMARVYAEAYAANAGRGRGHIDSAYEARKAVANFLKMLKELQSGENIL